MIIFLNFSKTGEIYFKFNSLGCFWDKFVGCSTRPQKKHGVTFDEAKAVFLDEHARIIADPEHSDDEERFIILGLSSLTRLLVVCHCYYEVDSTIRLISARKATRNESKQYRR